ncbi:hypothetical protein SprV_0301249900 [Sparganum proliferum]
MTGSTKNDAAISKLLAEKNGLHMACVNRPTDDNKTDSYRSRGLVQQRLREMQEAWAVYKANEIHGYADSNGWKNFFAATEVDYGPMAKAALLFSPPTEPPYSLRRRKFYSDGPSTSEAFSIVPPPPAPPSPV